MKKRKLPKVTINPELDKYDNVVLFPKKVEQGNKLLATMDPNFFKR